MHVSRSIQHCNMGREQGVRFLLKKTAKKRKRDAKIDESEDDEEETATGSDGKKMKTSFDADNFISQLKTDVILLADVLGNFCACAKEFTCGDGDIDAVQEYLQHSPQCAEIIDLLNSDKRPNSELQLIFNCLTSIILRLADDLHHFRSLFLPSLHILLRMHMRHVYRALNPKNTAKIIMAALRFLTAVVALDKSSAHEVLNLFKFDHGSLTPLFHRRNSKAEEDVRTCLMRFAIAFLVSGDQHTTTQFLANKDFLKSFFKGLVEDRASTLHVFLNAILEHLVCNPSVTKTQKLPVLNEFTLFQIAHLYGRWKGHYDIQDDEVEAAEDSEKAGQEAVRRLVHSFLTEVTTSTKHGINFFDKSLGLGGKNLNGALLKFLQMLKTATTDDLVGDLVVNILKTCPDLLQKYLSSCPFSFTPRASSSWLANMSFIEKIYKGQSDVSPAFTRTDKVGVSKLVSMVMVTTVPVVANHAFLLQCIKHQSPIVCLTGLQLIDNVMHKAQSNMEHSGKAAALLSSTEKQMFVKQYQETLLKILPDVDTLLSCWERYLIRMKGGNKQPGEVTGSYQGKSGDQNISTGLLQPEPAEILIHIMRILTSYTNVLPSAFLQTSFDFSRLLHGIFQSEHKTIDEGAEPTHHALQLQYETMKLLMGFDVGRFRWFKEVKGEGSAMNQLLTVLMTSTDPKIIQVSKQLISQVLKHTGQFDQCPDEPIIWLDAFSTVTSVTHDPKVTTSFLQGVLSKVVRNPYPLNDRIMEAVAEMEMEGDEDEGMEEDDDSKSMSEGGIAAILDMDEIPIGEASPDDEDNNADQSQNEEGATPDLGQSRSLPCSALVPAALEEFSTMKDNEKVADYLSQVLSSILNIQHNPVVVCTLVHHSHQNRIDSSKPVPSSWNRLLSYCNIWLPPSRKIKVSKKPKQSSSPSSLASTLQESFMKRDKLEDDGKMKQNILKRVPSIGHDEILPIMQQCLLYIGSCIQDSNNAASYYTDVFMAVLHQAKAMSSKDALQGQSVEKDQEQTDAMDTETEETHADSKQSCDWLKLSHVILRHPIVCQIKFDPFTARIGEMLTVLQEFVPHMDLQRELVALISAAEVEMRTLLVSSADDEHYKVITDLLVSLQGFIPPGRCLQILRNILSFLKEETIKDSTKKARSCTIGLSGLLSVVADYMHRASSTIALELYHQKVLPSERTTAAKGNQADQMLEFQELNSSDVADGLAVAVEEKSWGLFKAIGRLLIDHSHLVPSEVNMKGALSVCLDAPTGKHKEMGDEIIPILIRSNPYQFEDWILRNSKKRLKMGHLHYLYPAIAAYFSCPEEGTDRSQRCKEQLHNVCWATLMNDIIQDSTNQRDSNDRDDDDDVVEKETPVTSSSQMLCLILPYTPLDGVKSLFDALVDIPVSLSQPLTISQLEVLKEVTKIVVEQETESKGVLQQSILAAVLQSLVYEFKISAKDQDQLKELLGPILEVIEHLKDFQSDRDLAVTWKQFVISGLKTQYQNPVFLQLLTQLVQLVYSASHSGRKFMPLSKLYHAVVGHSKFLPTMLGPGKESADNAPLEVKGALVSLLLSLSEREPSCCDTVHFTILLGAYSARRTDCDRGLLSLMHIYEKNKANMYEYRPYIWGQEAVTQHSARKALGRTLWKQPSVEDVLKLLDSKLLHDSMLNFPLDQVLDPNLCEKSSSGGDSETQPELYDPCFLLPFFSHLLQPDNLVPCQTFVECNALGFVLASLSSNHDNVRRAGYHVLSCFIQHLEGARFRGRREIAFILEILRNSVSSPTLYIAPLLTIFIAKSIQQMLQPESALYPILISYLMFKPQLNLNKVPLFPRLFVGAEMQHKTEKTWFLSLLMDSLRSPTDFKLCAKSKVFQTLMAFYASPLCEKTIGDLIMGVMQKACEIPEGALQLIKRHNILIWIQAERQTGSGDGMDKLIGALKKSMLKQTSLEGQDLNKWTEVVDHIILR